MDAPHRHPWAIVTMVVVLAAISGLAAVVSVDGYLPAILDFGETSPSVSPPSSLAPSSAAEPTSLIPSDRLTLWNPGIPDGIPGRTTVCATVDAGTYGNGTQDASAGIQDALDACPVGQVVQLSAGDFKITSTLLIRKGIVLRGLGPAQTKLKMPVGTNDNLITVGTKWFKFTQPTDLASDGIKGRTSVTLARVPTGLAAGDIVLIDKITDSNITEWSQRSPPGDPSRGWFARPNRPLGQVMEIESVNGNDVTFTTPFHIDFQTAFAAQLTRFSNTEGWPPVPAVKYAGVEDLYVSGGGGGQGNIALSNAAYSWIKNIESDFQDGAGVEIAGSFRCVLRDSYIHSTRNPNPGGGGYGVSVSWASADNLIENNIVWNMNSVIVMRASGGGNVVGYNYMDDAWISYATSVVVAGLEAAHMTTPHYELFEGNQSFNFEGDETWGNSVYITVFRNHLTCKRRSAPPLRLTDVGNRRCATIARGHWWYSFVGNVLGYSGMTPPPRSWVFESQWPWTSAPAVWRFGYNHEDWKAQPDPKVRETVIREGNFDYVTGQVHWTNASQPVPPSLYLASKPAFFENNVWPWVDASGTTKLFTLPARARFDAMPGH